MSANRDYDNALNKKGIREFWGCNGIGNNICHFYFKKAGKYMLVAVIGGAAPNPSSKVLYTKLAQSPEEMDF